MFLERPPEGAGADWTVPQNWDAFTAEDHAVWDTLYERQIKLLPGRASKAFLRGLDLLKLSESGIPNFEELSERLMKATGWQVVAVPGLVPDDVFFDHMANRRFVAGNFIRRADQLDYLQEPDVFHDVFGHVPLLADPVFADYMEAYGRGGLRALEHGALKQLSRLYWYTVEFGLIEEDDASAHLRRGDRVEPWREPLRARQRQPQPDRLRPEARDADRTTASTISSRITSSSPASTNCCA
jgi:phenylalanine-4-hydroxylase